MSNSSLRQQALKSFGPILIKVGYEWVDMEAVAAAAGLESTELRTQFSSKALLCDAWMEETEDRSRRHHEALLNSGNSSRQVIDDYFQELESFMKAHEFGGCPFTNTATALRGRSEPQLEQRIREHKTQLRSFFRRLCERETFQFKMLSEALFLIYSGATTESSNLRSIEPVVAGRQASIALYDLYAIAGSTPPP